MSDRRIYLIMVIWALSTTLSAIYQLDQHTGVVVLPVFIAEHMTAIRWIAGLGIAAIGMPHPLATFVVIITLEFCRQLAGVLMVGSFMNARIFHRWSFANHELALALFLVALVATVLTLYGTRYKPTRQPVPVE